MNNEMTYINVEVETLNLENVKNDLLDYVDKNAKIDITESVKTSKKSALDAEVSAMNAANSAILASEYASQTITDLEQYYSKNQIDELLAGKVNIANTLTGYGITDAYTKSEVDTALSGKQNSLSSAQWNAVNSGITSAKVTQYDGYATGKANVGLDNLSSDGQMIIDSQNGTISNCILEIPQNIKMTLENNVLTLKAGSIITRTGSVYETYTTTDDKTFDCSNSANGKYYFIYRTNNNTVQVLSVTVVTSGSSLPESETLNHVFFNVTDKTFYFYTSNGWAYWGAAYPLAIIEVKNNVASFAKDSNGNDMIFNGAGFIGHHAFVYPNIKRLRADGFNADGTLASVLSITASLQIIEMASNRNTVMLDAATRYYQEVDDLSQAINSSWWLWYVKNLNTVGTYYNGVFTGRTYTPLVSYTLDNNSQVTSWTPREPVKLATTEMTDKIQSQVDTNTTAISTKADDSVVVKLTGNQTVAGVKTFTSNPVISNTQPQTQFVDSDFSKGTVPLSALRNTFFVLRDSSNLESGNIGTFYQRIDEYGNNYMAIVAFKNASGSNDNAHLGIYYNVDGTSFAECPTPPTGDNSIKIATTKWVNDYFASITGYDATKTQTLKNVSGTLTWVDD